MLLLLALIVVSFSAYSIFQKQSEQLDEMYTSELYGAYVIMFVCVKEDEKYATSVDYTRSVDRVHEIISEMHERGYSSDKVRLMVSQTEMKAKQYVVSAVCR